MKFAYIVIAVRLERWLLVGLGYKAPNSCGVGLLITTLVSGLSTLYIVHSLWICSRHGIRTQDHTINPSQGSLLQVLSMSYHPLALVKARFPIWPAPHTGPVSLGILQPQIQTPQQVSVADKPHTFWYTSLSLAHYKFLPVNPFKTMVQKIYKKKIPFSYLTVYY